MPTEGNVERDGGPSVPNYPAPELRAVEPELCSTVILMKLTFKNSLMLM